MKYLILGAGPAGLSFANELLQKGIDDFIVLEAEREAGGLCRSVDVDGSPLDTGGGHFLDVRRPDVNEFLFRFMPAEEWNHFVRDSRIAFHGKLIGHPFEANIWQMDVDDQVEYLKSIVAAGCNNGKSKPEAFVDWIYWKLGERISEDYMLPYNRKIFGNKLNQLGTYWMEKLPDVSFEDTLRSCITHKAYGTQPGHAEFFYPKKFGYGELWLRMADVLDSHIEYEKKVNRIDFRCNEVSAADGSSYKANYIITTIPWTEFSVIEGMPADLIDSIKELEYSSVQIEYHAETIDTDAQWIYYPDPLISYHRILVRSNFSAGSRGYWTETAGDRVNEKLSEGRFRYMNKYAYPLNTIRKPLIMKSLLTWVEKRGVYGLGRWGEHQHYNSDLVVSRALHLADKLSCYTI